MDKEGFVLGLHEHLIKETAACISLRIKDVGLTAAGVDQQTERERQFGFLRKIFDRLRPAIFLQREIVFGEVADDLAMLVANRDGQRYDLDVDGNGRSGVLSPHREADSSKNDQRGDQS